MKSDLTSFGSGLSTARTCQLRTRSNHTSPRGLETTVLQILNSPTHKQIQYVLCINGNPLFFQKHRDRNLCSKFFCIDFDLCRDWHRINNRIDCSSVLAIGPLSEPSKLIWKAASSTEQVKVNFNTPPCFQLLGYQSYPGISSKTQNSSAPMAWSECLQTAPEFCSVPKQFLHCLPIP